MAVDKSKLVLVVLGGVFPSGSTASIRPVLGTPSNPDRMSVYTTLEQAAEYPAGEDPATSKCYPHSARFEHRPSIMVGELEDIIAKFGSQMRSCYDLLRQLPFYAADAKQDLLERVFLQYCPAGEKVACVPFDHDGRCQRDEAKRIELDKKALQSKERKPTFTVAVDFDGTIVEHRYPEIGPPVDGACKWLLRFQELGANILLWTMRSDGQAAGDVLNQAIEFCLSQGVKFDGYNRNPTQAAWTSSPKAYATVYIDDAAFGCPLVYPDDARPFVDWSVVGPAVERMILQQLAPELSKQLLEALADAAHPDHQAALDAVNNYTILKARGGDSSAE